MSNDTATPELSYTTVDKSEWPRGEWDNEPDKVQWVDPATGMDCLIVRNQGGALCGYVGVPPQHPWHGVGYSERTCEPGCPKEPDWADANCYDHAPDGNVEVHGGLTYSDSCMEGADESVGICHVPGEGRPDNVWWFGFDTAHSGDVSPRYERYGSTDGWATYKWIGYVRQEVANLARQLAEVDA